VSLAQNIRREDIRSALVAFLAVTYPVTSPVDTGERGAAFDAMRNLCNLPAYNQFPINTNGAQ